ncbi:MAG: hypothetical protein Q8Q42_01095 [Nanoarchaeota archaeon]|nr:hypothetical protein [Nanoarchaeota archaeon]
MKMNKTLTSIVLAGALALSGCSGKVDDSRYDFKGKLGDEQVEFIRQGNFLVSSVDDGLYLTVTKADGKTITYIDRGNDLKLDEVIIGYEVYINDAVGQNALELAQQQFDGYLTKILEYKQQKAVDAIK